VLHVVVAQGQEADRVRALDRDPDAAGAQHELAHRCVGLVAVQLRQVGQRLAPRGQEDLGQLVRVRGRAGPNQELMGAQSISS
jgi:hypothetical protein